MRDRKGVDLDGRGGGEELGGGWETMIRIYYWRKKNLFLIKERKGERERERERELEPGLRNKALASHLAAQLRTYQWNRP